MPDIAEPRTALERARFGRKLGTGDRFVGLWLALSVEGRNYPLNRDARSTRRILKRFFGKEAKAALDEAGLEAVHEELRDAAQLFWGTCLTDPQYSSTLFGMKRLDDAQLKGKIADEYAITAQVMVDSRALTGPAEAMPALLLDGLLLALPGLEDSIASAVVKRPAVAALIADRLGGVEF